MLSSAVQFVEFSLILYQNICCLAGGVFLCNCDQVAVQLLILHGYSQQYIQYNHTDQLSRDLEGDPKIHGLLAVGHTSTLIANGSLNLK